MTSGLIELEWKRDAKGYKLVEPLAPGPGEPRDTILTRRPGRPQRIVRAGGKLMAYRPLAEYHELFPVFISDARSAEGLIRFVEKFGPLTNAGLDPGVGEEVPALLREAQLMRGLLEMRATRPQELVSRIGPGGMKLPGVQALVVADPVDGGLRLRLSPPDLLSALWMQLAQALGGGAKMRECMQCHEWFQVGAGTGRREDAKFCRDEHRIAFNSQKRTKGR